MMDDLLGNSEAMQKQMAEALNKVQIKEELEGIVVEATGNREITNITIPESLLSPQEKERLEDSLTVVLNRALMAIAKAEQQVSTKMMEDLLPGLSNLFGK
jgi:DNA-binding protein YbaB